MREIKFRAWDKTEKDMFTIREFTFVNNSVYSVRRDGFTSTGGFYTYPEKDNVVLMQYTGLKDKNGKEIYEGDIVRIEYLGWHTAPVEFIRGSFRLQTNGHIEEAREHLPIDFPFSSLEIIGNIYENKDLLA